MKGLEGLCYCRVVRGCFDGLERLLCGLVLGSWVMKRLFKRAASSSRSLRFPRVVGGYGKYGATGKPAFMTDNVGDSITIGLPTPIV